MKMTEKRRLCLFIVIVLSVPAVLNQVIPAKAHFNSKPIKRLRAKQPDLVLIGDSMLPSRIDADLLEKKLGCRVALVWNGGAASAWWYLGLKNYALAAGIHPKVVGIFFRDRLLTSASLRTTGIFRGAIESVMQKDEPIVRQVLGDDTARGTGLERWATLLYPLNGRRHVQHEKLHWIALRSVTMNGGHAARHLERRVNDAFDVNRLRGGVSESSELAGTEATPFDSDPAKSFLPHMVDLAARAHVRLVFVRVKRYPGGNGKVAQSESLTRYITELRTWLVQHGCVLIDDTNNPAFAPDLYLKVNDDHIGPWARSRSTEIYAEHFHSVLPPCFSNR